MLIVDESNKSSVSAVAGVDLLENKLLSKSSVPVFAGVDKQPDEASVPASAGSKSEDESEAVVKSMTVDPKSKKIVLKLCARSKATIHDDWVLIYDTASTVHLFKNIKMFDGVPEPVDVEEVNFCGFNTSQGQSFPVAIGTLKYPFEGIKAYYNPTTVGNIVSESLLAQSHHIAEKRYDNSELDTITASRRGGDWRQNLYWSRGIEGIFVTNIKSMPQSKTIEANILTVTTGLIRDQIEDQIGDWFSQLGLTELETNLALAFRRLFTPSDMELCLKQCLEILHYGSENILLIVKHFKESVSVLRHPNSLPSVYEFDTIIESLRKLDIADPGTLDRKRVRTSNSESSNKDFKGESGERGGDTRLKVSVERPTEGLDQFVTSDLNAQVTGNTNKMSSQSMYSSNATTHETKSSANANESELSSGQPSREKSLMESRKTLENRSNQITGGNLINFSQSSEVVRERSQNPSDRKGRSESSKTTMHNLGCVPSISKDGGGVEHYEPSSTATEEIVRAQQNRVTSKGVGQDKTVSPLFKIWLTRNKMSVQDLLVGMFVSNIGLTSRSEIVALSLEQVGLNKSQIDRISYVENLHRLTSFVGIRSLRNIVQSKSIQGLRSDINIADVDNYHDHIHETDCACSIGKMTTPPACRFDLSADGIHTLHCDIMQLTTEDKEIVFRFLVGVDQMTQFVFVVQVKSLSDKEARRAFGIIYKAYQDNCIQDKKLKRVILDNAGAFLSEAFQKYVMSKELSCIFATPGLHVRIAEATIKQIKALARTTVITESKTIKFMTAFVPLLVPWIVDSINFTLRSGNNSLSPFSRFTRKTVSLENHFPAAFLDIVAVPEITDDLTNLESRSRIGFVVARDMAGRGVVTIMDFESGRFMKRRNLKIMTGDFYVKRASDFLKSDKFKKGAMFNKEFTVGNLAKFNLPSEMYDITAKEARTLEDDVLFDDETSTGLGETPTGLGETPTGLGKTPTDSIMATTVAIYAKIEDLFLIPTEPDGSCLFASIEYYFKRHSGNSALELRNSVCEYILYNQLEYLDDISIRDLVIANSRDLAHEVSVEEQLDYIDNLSDSEHFNNYIQTLQRSDGWAESLEIIILAKLKELQIMIFTKKGTKMILKDIFGERIAGSAPKVCMLYFDGKHYEPINLCSRDVVTRILRSANLERLGGDILDSSFLYNNHSRFAKYNEYAESVKKVKEVPVGINEYLHFDSKNGFNLNESHAEEIHDERKLINAFCMITLADTIEEPKPDAKSVNDIISELNSDASKGAKNLRARRPLEASKAIQDEIEQMHKKHVWEYMSSDDIKNDPILSKKRSIPIIMLVKEKFDSQGSFLKVKARAVALGNRQEAMEVWSKEAPTASIQSFYIVIFLAAKFNIELESFDVTGAFLNAWLPEEEVEIVILSKKHADIAIKLKPELAKKRRSDGSLLAKLIMCLYGLKQSPRKWYFRIREILKRLGFTMSEHDSCLFFLIINEKVNYLLLFVDDLLVAFQDKILRNKLYETLIAEFDEISSQSGEVISFLGITIRQSESHISLDQEGFITKLIMSLNLPKIPVYTNPVRSDFNVCSDRFLTPQSEADPARLKRMRQLTMAVMYCALRCRRDVLFITSFLASIKCPTQEDIEAIIRVIVYLYNTIGKRQFFYRQGPIDINIWCDASHNLFADARGQHCVQIYGDRVSAALDMTSNKGKVTESSFEDELITLNVGVNRGIMTSLILKEMSVPHELPMYIYSDNEAAVLTANQEHINKMGRTKFMNRKLFYIYDKVLAKWVKPTHVGTEENNADIGTKNLYGSHFDYLANRQFTRMHGATSYGTDATSSDGSGKDNNSVKTDESTSKEVSKSSSKSDTASVKIGGGSSALAKMSPL